jgi:DNA-binding transcriptional MerR regulator/effector-binding domain-containing protein
MNSDRKEAEQMFRIGEFAELAQISSRQLRLYDKLGILQPAYTDDQTGYRYYGIRQLPQLNRILSLKQIGLSLDQIAALLAGGIAPSLLRSQLVRHHSEVKKSLADNEARLRRISSRLRLIDSHGTVDDLDVVVKSVAAQPLLSVRHRCWDPDEATRMVHAVAVAGKKHIRSSLRDKLVVIRRSGAAEDELELEIGYSLTRAPRTANVRIDEDITLCAGELPAVEIMVTVTRQFSGQHRASLSTMAAWIEANHYQISGPCREVLLEPLTEQFAEQGLMAEIQFPVRMA